MTGGTLAIIGAYLALFFAWLGVHRGGYGYYVRYHLPSIIFWLGVAVVLLIVSLDPQFARRCFGC